MINPIIRERKVGKMQERKHSPHETRTAVFDRALQMEAYHFSGIMQDFPRHFHDYYVVGYVAGGRRYMTCKNSEHTICSGDLVLFNPLDTHACRQADCRPLDWRCINIGPETLRRAARDITGRDTLPVFAPPVVHHSGALPLLAELHGEIQGRGSDLRKEKLFYLLVQVLLRDHADRLSADAPTVSAGIEQACRFMDRHCAEALTLDTLCHVCGMNKFTLIRSFTRERGMTPYQYLQTVRISRAKRLLESGAPPAEAAVETGFTDQSHFTRYFKNMIGLPPGEYQKIFRGPSPAWRNQ